MGRVEGAVHWIMGENTEHPTGDRALNKIPACLELTFLWSEKRIPKKTMYIQCIRSWRWGLRTERNVETESSPGGFPEGKEQVR